MDLSAGFVFTCPFKTNSGNKALSHLPVELAGFNAARPLVVASAGTEGQKAVRILKSAFGDSGMTLALFDNVTQAADLGLVDHLKNLCLEKKVDAVIALGGGKAADVAKVLNLAVSLKTPDARQLLPETPIRVRLLPLVVAPAAGADGLETSRFAH
ncbi:MAG: iron-containing alcohol dehydrogenase, partial [Smithella sp.]|nr:iron-containing alcohol dehydrogenase [Smithella sp.]